jgi:hypothetical protein
MWRAPAQEAMVAAARGLLQVLCLYAADGRKLAEVGPEGEGLGLGEGRAVRWVFLDGAGRPVAEGAVGEEVQLDNPHVAKGGPVRLGAVEVRWT